MADQVLPVALLSEASAGNLTNINLFEACSVMSGLFLFSFLNNIETYLIVKVNLFIIE